MYYYTKKLSALNFAPDQRKQCACWRALTSGKVTWPYIFTQICNRVNDKYKIKIYKQPFQRGVGQSLIQHSRDCKDHIYVDARGFSYPMVNRIQRNIGMKYNIMLNNERSVFVLCINTNVWTLTSTTFCKMFYGVAFNPCSSVHHSKSNTSIVQFIFISFSSIDEIGE